MAHYITTYEDEVSLLIAAHNEKTNPENLDREAYDRLSWEQRDLPENDRREILNQIKLGIETESRKTVLAGIEFERDLIRKRIANDSTKVSRQGLQATSGLNLIEAYAKAHGIDKDEARHELQAYAAVKRNGFSDSVQDRYAAIVNKASLEGAALTAAWGYEQDELKSLGIEGTVNDLKSAQYYADAEPLSTLSGWNTSGAIIARQLSRRD
ncbi:MAG: hypothetical protein Q8M92_11010 [Candidatus Subteraquimicrobiales bacterium]|nr:hypothetical protein [Candidatus Subteraquimicrobiales bacterium]